MFITDTPAYAIDATRAAVIAADLNAEADDGTSYRLRTIANGRAIIDVYDADGDFVLSL